MNRRTLHLVVAATAIGCGGFAWADDQTGEPERQTPEAPFAEAVAYAQRRCVKLYGAAIGREHGYATGMIVSPSGDILTAEGIYLEGDRIRAVTADGRVHLARVQRRSESLRVALLAIDAATPAYFDLPEEPTVRPGDWTLAISNCFKAADGTEPLSVNLGVVSLRAALDTRRRAMDFDVAGEILLIDAITSNPGSPGGALVDDDGRPAGMIGKLLESESTGTRLNYAIPADLLRRFLDGKPIIDPAAGDGDEDGPTGEPYLGVRLFRMAGRKAPAYIDRVIADSPAARAGLKKDDLLLAIDDRIVRHVSHYDQLLAALKPGQKVTLIVKRKQDVLEVALTVGAEAAGDE